MTDAGLRYRTSHLTKAKGDVWIATGAEITSHYEACEARVAAAR